MLEVPLRRSNIKQTKGDVQLDRTSIAIGLHDVNKCLWYPTKV